jgi:hypothetical protein
MSGAQDASAGIAGAPLHSDHNKNRGKARDTAVKRENLDERYI